VSVGFSQKDKNQGCDLFKDLAEKTLQWEPTSEKPRNSQSIASKGGLLAIESSITAEAKIATLMRRLEALEIKEPTKVNQINPQQIHNPGYIVRNQTMFKKSAQFFKLINYHWNT